MTTPDVGEPRARAGMAAVLGRLWMCGLFAAVVLGAYDVIAHAPALRWYEATEIVGLYALFGGVAAAVTLPFAALLLLPFRRWLGPGRAAAALLWLGLATEVLLAFEQRALGRLAALVALGLASLIAARAAVLRSFETTTRWHVRRGLVLLMIAGLILAPPIARRQLAERGPGEHAARSGGRPDVVLIVLDTLRADHLGAYGDARGLSPSFDAFAKESALYADCYSPAPWTVPSHASLFTALQPPTHGCSFEHHRWLDNDFQTLAEALAARDYDTAAFVANEYLFPTNLLQGFAVQEALGERVAALAIRPLLELLGWPARYADHGADDAIERIDGWLARREGDKPLFLFVNLLEAHWRYLPPLSERWDLTHAEPGLIAATDVSRQFYGPYVMAGKPVKGPVEPSIRALYAAAVKYQDEKLGELLAVLRRRLDLDHGVVAITADHGENLGEGGRFDHVFALDDALLHVPLAIRDPAAFPAGRIDGLCQLVDVPETLLALTGRDGDAAKLCDRSAGRSLLPGKFQPREVVVGFGDPYLGHLAPMERFAGFNRDVARYVGVLRSIRDGSRKLVRSTTRDDELYDLRADRDEIHDVAASDPAAPAVIDALGKRLDEELKALPGYDGPPRRPPKDPDLGPANDPRLQQLGYSQPPPR